MRKLYLVTGAPAIWGRVSRRNCSAGVERVVYVSSVHAIPEFPHGLVKRIAPVAERLSGIYAASMIPSGAAAMADHADASSLTA